MKYGIMMRILGENRFNELFMYYEVKGVAQMLTVDILLFTQSVLI